MDNRLQEVERYYNLPQVGANELTIPRELVTVKGQFQTAQSELYTINSNHAQLLRWTLDMGETMKALLKWLAEHIGANIVGQDGF